MRIHGSGLCVERIILRGSEGSVGGGGNLERIIQRGSFREDSFREGIWVLSREDGGDLRGLKRVMLRGFGCGSGKEDHAVAVWVSVSKK